MQPSDIVKFARYNVRGDVEMFEMFEVFSNKCKLKGKQISISESLQSLRLMKLKEDQCTFANVWIQDGKKMFKDDNKFKVYFD